MPPGRTSAEDPNSKISCEARSARHLNSKIGRVLCVASVGIFLGAASAARALDQPWISDTYFYWYTWDYEQELGSWMGGVHNTPLSGYYDSRTYRDNRRSLWQASEWGVTHHFMDYWTPTWKDEHGEMREKTVMRAAESLRAEGYNIWMSYYQDGTNFEMKDFSKNVSEKRDVQQWLRDFARSPVWPRLNGYPLQLVYGRNGRPVTSEDHAGFRQFLRAKYPSIADLNRQWGTSFQSFDEIQMSFAARGFQRAFSIKYQYEIWRKEWERLDVLVKKEFGLPGVRASFDVGYQPFLGFGYSDFARVFTGPHSYGGIFRVPHDQDVERYIQAAVAKKYNTIFFDHFKNYYHDWGIRVPGSVYWPDPFNFDRFWVGALMRRSEALLHLSWNEWWEGSNLEPCQEFGKTYPQKNLFYSTLMQLCFPSIRESTSDAEIKVLLNDWCFLAGGGRPEDLYETVQALRRLNVAFDLVPDDFVTEEALAKARIVIAPQCQTGLGLNARGERITDVLWRWITTGRERRLITSRDTWIRDKLGLLVSARPVAAPTVPGPDLNVFVDVGAEGDDQFLLEGASGREDWKKLPQGAFGAGTGLTIRWTPGQGSATLFRLPASPGRDHLLRFAGNALWPNAVKVLIDQNQAGSVPIQPGYKEYELKIPAQAVGGAKVIELSLMYEKTHIPTKVDPKRYPSESRVCNLALDWLQFSTSNVPAKRREPQFVLPKSEIDLVSEVFKGLPGRKVECAYSRHDPLDVPPAQALSRYAADGVARDVVKPLGDNAVLYVNGLFSDLLLAGWWKGVLSRWAGVGVKPLLEPAAPDAKDLNIMSARLSAGDTDLVLAANYDISQPQKVMLNLSPREAPLSEAMALSRDGKNFQPLFANLEGQMLRTPDTFQYYAVYQFAFAPVRVTTPAFLLQPGERREFKITVKNLTDQKVEGAICARSVIPTLVGQPVSISLEASQEREFPLTLEAKEASDWGVKTIALELDFEGRKAYLFRDVTVLAPPDLRLVRRIVPANAARIEIENRPNRLMTTGDAEDVRVMAVPAAEGIGHLPIPAQAAEAGTISSGQKAGVEIKPSPQAAVAPLVAPYRVTIEYKAGGRPRTLKDLTALVAHPPQEFDAWPGALAALTVFNGRDRLADHVLVRCAMKALGLPEKKVCMRDRTGALVPSQISESGDLILPVMVAPRSGQAFVVCDAKPAQDAAVPTDLRVLANDLGTGRGRLTIANSHFSLTLDEAKGGTVTEFKSAATGRNYGAQSFGVAYGTFGNFDPNQPASNSVKYISESKTRQASAPAKVSLVAKGPVLAVATVEWRDKNVAVQQTYEVGAYQSYFLLRQVVKPTPSMQAQEIVALDARFVPHALCKTYPNFVGQRPKPNENWPHYGWRYGNWIPDYLTIMEDQGFQESISLIPIRHTGLDQVRQGFWPLERPKPGPRALAEIEFITHVMHPVEMEVYVLLHEGHQIVARQFREDVENPLLVIPRPAPKWRAERREPPPARDDWFDAFWHYRVPFAFASPRTADDFFQAKCDLKALLPGADVDENSLRLVQHDGANAPVFIPFAFDPAEGILRWRADRVVGAKQGSRLFLYFDTRANGPKPRPPQGSMSSLNIRPDGEVRVPEDWLLANAELLPGAGPQGRPVIKMRSEPQESLALVQNRAIQVLPKTAYKVSLLARAPRASVLLHTNFYQGAAYDFPHGAVQVKAGDDWQRYEVTIRTGEFTPEVRPVFRLWTTEKDKEVEVCAISVEPTLALSDAKLETGKIETNGIVP